MSTDKKLIRTNELAASPGVSKQSSPGVFSQIGMTLAGCRVVLLKKLFLAGLLMMVAVSPGWSHGGKTHKGFTALQALQKATALYDQLVAGGKLDESWEVELVEVTVTPPEKPDSMEFTIRFSRMAGDPSSVYFFLTPEGEYAGSNFTGP